jgi:hypothetical protein
MHLAPHEVDKLTLVSTGLGAVLLNYPNSQMVVVAELFL